MESQSFTIVINRPISEVFAYMDDIEREREWQPKLQEVEQIPPGPSSIGTKKRYTSVFMKKRVENTYEVTEMGPGWRIVYRTMPGSSLEATNEVTCESVDSGTRVTIVVTAEPAGAFRLVPKRVLEKASREELEESLERLKACLEA